MDNGDSKCGQYGKLIVKPKAERCVENHIEVAFYARSFLILGNLLAFLSVALFFALMFQFGYKTEYSILVLTCFIGIGLIVLWIGLFLKTKKQQQRNATLRDP